ncbi:MAG: hypothetical protein GF364_19455 [Candidatus Lokiarchaeota archaeon]|nr:hypothetical protein [Candidatus Lokiarchaeota archaeon]
MTENKDESKELTAEEKVQYKKVGKVGYLTLNNPDKRNAIDMPMVHRILSLLDEIDKNPKIRCLVINSIGDKSFSAGWDLAMFSDVSEKTIDNLLQIGAKISRKIFFLKKPVIVQVQGPAVGMGTIMSLAADFRIVADRDDIFFQLPEINIGPGIPPATGPTVGAVSLLGIAHAKDMLLTGRKVSLEEFDSWGAVTKIVSPPDKLKKVVKKYARKLSLKAPSLLYLSKTAINIMGNRIAKECWELENEMAYHYFNGMLNKDVKEDDEFIKDLWEKYGKGKP